MKLEWSYFQRTIPNTSNMYKPLEDYIKNKLIPALTGHSCSDREILTPLILSTTGRWGKETTKFHKQLANLIAEKRGESYNTVMTFIRKRLRFTLLRTILESLRGTRGLKMSFITYLDLNIVDHSDSDRLLFNI